MPMINKTCVHGGEEFIYTFQVSFCGLAQPAQNGYLVDFFPSGILYQLPKIGDGVTTITTDVAPGGTNVTFHFGPVDENTALSFSLPCSFGPSHQNGDSFTNTASLYADGVLINRGSTPAVTLDLAANFKLSHISPATVKAGQTIACSLLLENISHLSTALSHLAFTEILPPQLLPDTAYIPTGKDLSDPADADNRCDNLSGIWSGNLLQFALPRYKGRRYQIAFQAKVVTSVTPGEAIFTTAQWWVNDVEQRDAPAMLCVAGEGIDRDAEQVNADACLPKWDMPLNFDHEPNGLLAQLLLGGDVLLDIAHLPDMRETLTAVVPGLPSCPPPCPPPMIHACDRCLPLCASFQPLAGVTATDCQGRDLTQCILVQCNNVNTALPGCYHVRYCVGDCRGQSTLKTITVTVHTAEGCEQAVNGILESVALEQTALAHLLNAEGEKIQGALALPCITVSQLLEVNARVNDTVESVIRLEQALLQKLNAVKRFC